MLTFEQIKELIELVSRHRLEGVELERSGFRLKIDGEPAPAAAATGQPVASAAAPAPGAAPATATAPALAAEATAPAASGPPGRPPAAAPERAAAELPADAHVLSSPIVGTYYAAPNPDAKPYARIGDRVEKGQVLCIVEAMKLMNEIESDVDGVVLEIYPTNGQPVEYGEPLFALQPG